MMITVEEQCFKSDKTDASLYNGRPINTSTQCAMLHDKNVSPIESCLLLSYYYDHTFYRQDNPERNFPLVIQDEAMDNFIKLTSVNNPHIIPVTSQNIQYKLGDHVIVTESNFGDIQGRVARIAGLQRVIVELFSGCLVATAYIPKEEMKEKVKTVRLMQ